MFCRNCGGQINDQAEIFVKCGVRPFSEKKFCQNCGVETNPKQEICIKCGLKLITQPIKNDSIQPSQINTENMSIYNALNPHYKQVFIKCSFS